MYAARLEVIDEALRSEYPGYDRECILSLRMMLLSKILFVWFYGFQNQQKPLYTYTIIASPLWVAPSSSR